MMLGETAELFAGLLPVQMSEQHPIWLLRTNLPLQYLGEVPSHRSWGRTISGANRTSQEGGMVFKACIEPIQGKRISHCQIFCLYWYRCILYLVSSIFHIVSSL